MNAYLAHYGIKDMKWGVRRYQNEDGTLTPEGISRYRKNSESIAKLKKDVEKYRNSATRAKANADVYAANRDKVKARRFQTDLSIGKAESLERKRARASYDAAKYEKYAVQTEAKIRKLEKENGSLLTSDPKVSEQNRKAIDGWMKRSGELGKQVSKLPKPNSDDWKDLGGGQYSPTANNSRQPSGKYIQVPDKKLGGRNSMVRIDNTAAAAVTLGYMGYNNSEIASKLGISEEQVKKEASSYRPPSYNGGIGVGKIRRK